MSKLVPRVAFAAIVAVLPAAPAQANNKIGLGCGMATLSDLENPFLQGLQIGVVTGGPVTVAGATSVSIFCTVSVNDAVIDSNDVTVGNTLPGPTGAFVSPIEYGVFTGIPVYLCTSLSWTTSSGSGSESFCTLAASIEYTDPPADRMIRVDTVVPRTV